MGQSDWIEMIIEKSHYIRTNVKKKKIKTFYDG